MWSDDDPAFMTRAPREADPLVPTIVVVAEVHPRSTPDREVLSHSSKVNVLKPLPLLPFRKTPTEERTAEKKSDHCEGQLNRPWESVVDDRCGI